MKIAKTTPLLVADLWAEALPRIAQASSLEDGAQALAEAIHRRFEESVVMARVFTTVDFGALPAPIQEFARGLASSSDSNAKLGSGTPVLVLLGTHGEEPDWCNRRLSKGHAGIPLITTGFVEGIPMIARLLHDLGLPLEWVDTRESDVVQQTIGHSDGIFFVPDAREATDALGRKVIAAQDFVQRYRVGSVFGLGGVYETDQILVAVVFCRDHFDREKAEQFLPLTSLFESETQPLVLGRAIFAY